MFPMMTGRESRMTIPRALALLALTFTLSAAAQGSPASSSTAAPTATPDSVAAATAPAADDGASTLQDLEEKIGIVERKLEIAEEEAQKKKEEGSTATAGKDGFVLKSNDGDFQLKWRGYVQADGRLFLDDPDEKWANTYLLRRVRPIWEATAYKYYGVRIMTDFAGGTLQLLDAHVDVNLLPEAKFRIGKFKAPIGLERLQSATDIHFVERTYPTSFVPNRDIGAQIYGDLWDESFSYALGLFNGVPDGANREADSTDEKDAAGRIFAQPFKPGNIELLRNLGIGFSASYGKVLGDSSFSNLSAVRSPAQLTVFQYRAGTAGTFRDTATVRAYGTHIRLNPHGYWSYGPFGLFGEWISSSHEVSKGKAQQFNTELTSTAWNVTASYLLTGETPGFRNPKPRHALAPTEPGKGGFAGLGAIELVGRVAQFKADPDAFPLYANPASSVKEALTYSGGVNLHLSRAVKWATDYEFTQFEGGAAANVNGGNRLDEHILFTRFQFSL